MRLSSQVVERLMGSEQKGVPEEEILEVTKGVTLEETPEEEITQEEGAAEEVATATGGITISTMITQEAKTVIQITTEQYKTGIQKILE